MSRGLKRIIKSCVPNALWRKLRLHGIIKKHNSIVVECERLIDYYEATSIQFSFTQKHKFDTDKIIWQYWAQGFEDVPVVVRDCLDSISVYCPDYRIVRLDDSNLYDYLELPEWLEEKRRKMSRAHFSDILRVILLRTYGGVWIDATIKLTGPIPEKIKSLPFFVFRRDDDEPNKSYWEDTYAYYFGWDNCFRVRMLNSFMVVNESSSIIPLADCLLLWWKKNDYLPDYFFFQILYEVLVCRGYSELDCQIISDTFPHYLQQSINDPGFSIEKSSAIVSLFPIHKLTYKREC